MSTKRKREKERKEIKRKTQQHSQLKFNGNREKFEEMHLKLQQAAGDAVLGITIQNSWKQDEQMAALAKGKTKRRRKKDNKSIIK